MTNEAAARRRLSRMQNLAQLQRWTVQNVPQNMWDTEEAIEAMTNFCLAAMAKSRSVAKDYAYTVRARLLTGIKPVVVPTEETQRLSIAEEEKLSITEIISGYRASLPPPPVADHPIHEEE